MPTYRFKCACGADFERFLRTSREDTPACPGCAEVRQVRKVPTGIALIGRPGAVQRPQRAPQSWQGTGGGDREYVSAWRRRLESERDRTGDPAVGRNQAVCAHEGLFERNPLTYQELADRSVRAGGDTTAALAEATRRRAPQARTASIAAAPRPTRTGDPDHG